MTPQHVPKAVFHIRVHNEKLGGDNQFDWQTQSKAVIFAGKRFVLFALPGAGAPLAIAIDT